MEKTLPMAQQKTLLETLKNRFEKNMHRHMDFQWDTVQDKLLANPDKMWSLHEMENTGGKPDVIVFNENPNEIIFCDCAPESPKGRRSVCYDNEALESRKEYKPENSAIAMAAAMGIEILTEEQYRKLQSFGTFDTKTSSWIKTPAEIRNLGGALFADFRYGNVFVYHNGAQSYYASRGFRGLLKV